MTEKKETEVFLFFRRSGSRTMMKFALGVAATLAFIAWLTWPFSYMLVYCALVPRCVS